jgi:hypothetical protein
MTTAPVCIMSSLAVVKAFPGQQCARGLAACVGAA